MSGLILTGASGALGRLVAERAERAGIPVISIGRDTVRSDGGVQGHDGTAADIARALGHRPDHTVIHCAAFNSPQDRLEDAERLVQGNIGFGFSVLQAAIAADVRRFLNFGSFWQFGPDGKDSPVNAYAAMKLAFQTLLDHAASAHGLSAVSLILSDTYAEYDPRPKLLNQLRDTARSGERLPMSDGLQKIAPLHLDDALEAVFIALSRLEGGAETAHHHARYFVMGSQVVSIRGLVDIVARQWGAPLDIAWGERPKLARIPETPYTSGPALPDWSPEVLLEEGIARVLQTA